MKKKNKDDEATKDAIRARYKRNPGAVEIIPALPQENIFEGTDEKRVAVYVRVSTDSPEQTTSFELQRHYYATIIERHENWRLVEIYADEGISGTSLKNRNAFLRMIADCKAGKVDLVVTKSVSRFSRNVADCLECVRELEMLDPPVGVLFESEGIYTLNRTVDMGLTIICAMAQEESRIKSNAMNASIEMRFQSGILLTPPLLGYDLDEDGNLVVNEEEAKTVRLIFFMYLYGYSSGQIAETLTRLGCVTKKGGTEWSLGGVLDVLQNERHCGDVLARKTWTPNYLDHKSKKNRKNRNQYRYTNHHEAIVTRDDFFAVQHLIRNAKYGNKGFLPELKVIDCGLLAGFVIIHPHWGAFSDVDYQEASASVDDADVQPSPPLKVEARAGDFDLRGFEVVRSQFFNIANKLCVTFSREHLWFSTECVRKLGTALYVEILVHPRKLQLAVRPCSKESKNAVKWAKIEGDAYGSRFVPGKAFLHALYGMSGWDPALRYRARGGHRQRQGESLMMFDMREAEVFIPAQNVLPENTRPLEMTPNKNAVGFPSAWAKNFGGNYYRHAQARKVAPSDKWDVAAEGRPYGGNQNVTKPEVIDGSIRQMIGDMKKKGSKNETKKA